MSPKYESYIGFSYNGKHSSELGIVRVSDGSRFNHNLLPTMQDKTVQVPGGDGTYYFGSYYTQRQFPVSFAFDGLTEKQVSEIGRWLGDKGIHDLIFDEVPYKTYRAKVTGTATLKYIPFGEGENNRLYKGEGSIQFTCYYPFARCSKKWLNSPNPDSGFDYNFNYDLYDNKEEWVEASGLIEYNKVYDKFTDRKIQTYNPGDLEADWQLEIPFSANSIQAFKMSMNQNNNTINSLKLGLIQQQGADTKIVIDSKLNLIEGYDSSNRKTGNVYNKYIQEGDFFKIPIGTATIVFDEPVLDQGSTPLKYDYLYF